MNCENEMKMKKWSSQWTQFMQLRKEAWKKFRTSHIINTHFFHGNIWTHNWEWLHSSVGRASHRYREVTGSNPVEVLNFFSGFFRQLNKLRSLRRSFLHFQIPYSHLISRVLNFAIFTSFAIWETSRNLILAKSKNPWKSRNEILAKSENRYIFKSINLVSRRGSLAV